MLTKCGQNIFCACSTFHEDLKWFSFMTKNIELWENLLTKQWEIFKKHSSSNCSQTTTRMKKRSAKCLVNILVKNSFFNIWSTFKQHNYVDQSISVSQIRYIESLELCYCIQHLGNYCYPNVDQMLKNESIIKLCLKMVAGIFFVGAKVWPQTTFEKIVQPWKKQVTLIDKTLR